MPKQLLFIAVSSEDFKICPVTAYVEPWTLNPIDLGVFTKA